MHNITIIFYKKRKKKPLAVGKEWNPGQCLMKEKQHAPSPYDFQNILAPTSLQSVIPSAPLDRNARTDIGSQNIQTLYIYNLIIY